MNTWSAHRDGEFFIKILDNWESDRRHSIYIGKRNLRDGDGSKIKMISNVEFTEIDPYGLVYESEPTARVFPSDLQNIFNELWKIGFRPKDGTGNSGHVEAMKYHLEDMRKLVFKEAK